MPGLIKTTFRFGCVAFFAATLAGCGDGTPEPIVPDKPPLSAEQAKQNTEKLQRELVKAMELQGKSLKKK